MNNLRVSLIQQVIEPNNPQQNLEHFASAMASLPETDLIVLPEVFTTGFCSGARQYAEQVGGRAWQWMAAQAEKHQAVVTGSLVVKIGDTYYNRMLWMRPDGTFEVYDKRHLFRMAGEHTRYAMGNQRLIVELKGWQVLPLICYDLRFPVWSRNRTDYDLALYVANWPSARALHWNRLLQARAIENLSYVVGVNRVGMDEAGQHYAGDSSVYGPAGELIGTSQEAECLTLELYGERLREYRDKFPAYLDADEFRILV
ncbi:amidohydrolase [Cellvibrio japonicus]|uniref:Omega-amidase YafV n=1 Tax=Cellvibrio japonicus (strain Ueda107) TaxID=498211 RepID=B3PGU3_CELJU|nr:amidohydrolase [Cellvibrio japonicus]ACE85805.1 carbon-nitrogen hydrolase family protein [Cellvibrio japonicus Ueda107]QEI12435.1 amidohydrolase [Cellvibrio japonicus]QEI16008.1 amidohydrolase [Cellvibrio japonicus]QEI19587.1 amidohydrolase [Cellvibrio japonicus]